MNYSAPDKQGKVFDVNDQADAPYNYKVISNGTGWLGCDAATDGNFTNFGGTNKSEGDRETSGGDNYICSDGYSLSFDENFTKSAVSYSKEDWVKCDIPGKMVNVSDGTVYFCSDGWEWVTDLDKQSDGETDITVSTSGACDASNAYIEGSVFLDFDHTMTKCCGDDFVEKGVFEYYSDSGNDYIGNYGHNNQHKANVGGCWNGRKIAHGLFLEDVFTDTPDDDTYHDNLLLDGYFQTETNTDKFWVGTHNSIIKNSNDIGGNNYKGVILDASANHIETKYSVVLTKYLEYDLTITLYSTHYDDDKLNISSGFFGESPDDVWIIDIESDQEIYTKRFTANSFKEKIRLEAQFATSGEIKIVSMSLKPVPNRILNDQGQFYVCNDTQLVNDFNTESTLTSLLENDFICDGHDFTDLSHNDYKREFFCHRI
jgi:hypothetical protein